MFTSLVSTLAFVASVSALVVPRATPPAGWITEIMEPYTDYNTRYMALGCNLKHNTPFFDLCCHPLKKGETLATARDASCDPSKAPVSSVAAVKPTTTAAVKPTQSAVEDNDDEDLPYCEDEGDDDDESTPVSSPSPKPTSTPAPKPTSTSKPTQAPTTSPKPTPKPTTTDSPKPASTPKPDNGNSNAAVNTGGFATFFYQNGVAGACGKVHGDNELVVAMDYRRYGNLSVKSPLCGKQVKITNAKNGKSVVATVADACPTCNNGNSIDLSVGAFEKIATKAEGLVGITWSFV